MAGSPLWSWPFLLLMLLCKETSVTATRRSLLQDPCAFAANPEDCHYEQAKSLLTQLSPDQAAPMSPSEESLVEVTQDVKPESTDLREATTADINVDSADDGDTADINVDSADDLQLKKMVLKQTLDVLEGEAPASPSLENVTLKLEQELEDIQPGALEAFRKEHLAAAINSQERPPAAHLRAAVAANLLSAADWERKSEVPGAIAKLEHVAHRKRLDKDKYLCSYKSCSSMGCGSGADPSNDECDPMSPKKCADGHGVCRSKRGTELDGTFKIEIMREPGHFLFMPEWDEDKIQAISPVEHKKGEPDDAGLWHIVHNSDDTLMMYTKKWGPDYWLSIEEDTDGTKVLAYRAFTSPVACSFTVHTNKEGDQVYLRDVPFKNYIADDGKGKFKPDAVLDKKAANLKFHPDLPKEVEMIADAAYCMSTIPVILVFLLSFNF